MRVLVVDDDPGQRQTIGLILRRRGCAVDTADSGETAVRRAASGDYDLILMDIRMPDINGVEAYRRIRAVRPQARVAVMTAYALEDLVQEAVREGACGVFHKPLDMDRIVEFVNTTTKRPIRRDPGGASCGEDGEDHA